MIQLRKPLKTLFSRHCERSEAVRNIGFHWIALGYRPRYDVQERFLEVLYIANTTVGTTER